MKTPSRTKWPMSMFAMAGIAGLALTGCTAESSGSGSASGIESTTLKVATMYGPENWQTLAMQEYTDAITASTDGAITFEYFYGDALLGSDELASGLKDGIIDLATFVPTYTAASFPTDAWASDLGYMADPSPVAGALQGIAATMEWGFETDGYHDELVGQGLQPLVPRYMIHHKYGVLCSSENATLDALAGKRARVGSASATGEAEALNMVPTSVAGAETYSAFQQGVLDCSWTNVPDMMSLSLTDHAKYYNSAGLMGFSSMALAMGETKWASLSPEAQAAIWGELPVYLEAMIRGNFEANIDALDVDGMNWLTPDAAVTETITEYHAQLDSTVADNAPGTIDDPQAAVDAMRTANDEWLATVTDLGYDADAASWDEYVSAHSAEVPDLQPYIDAITEQILDEHAPN